ncbi:MAG TPA: Rieske 2Fe-2S domain-containing protein [Ktedonobacterales bacterium]|nr:Rieske 2Fe-2S domain-containing protein [Ktedonobacterales bacterium]
MTSGEDNLEVSAPTPLADPPAVSRRTALRRLWLLAGGAAAIVAAEACGATLWGLYPSQANRFGGPQMVGGKSEFPAALPGEVALGSAGVFYRAEARAFIVHLSATTEFLLAGSALTDALATASITRDGDGSYWLALSPVCPHLGAPLPFLNACLSFKCPSHGAHFHCDGEYLDGPSPRSMDRFPLRFEGTQVVVDTGSINRAVARPQPTARLLDVPSIPCVFG